MANKLKIKTSYYEIMIVLLSHSCNIIIPTKSESNLSLSTTIQSIIIILCTSSFLPSHSFHHSIYYFLHTNIILITNETYLLPLIFSSFKIFFNISSSSILFSILFINFTHCCTSFRYAIPPCMLSSHSIF